MTGKKITAPLGAASADKLKKQIVRSLARCAGEGSRTNSFPHAGFSPQCAWQWEAGCAPVNAEGAGNKVGSAQGIIYRDCPGGHCRGHVAYGSDVRRLISVLLARGRKIRGCTLHHGA